MAQTVPRYRIVFLTLANQEASHGEKQSLSCIIMPMISLKPKISKKFVFVLVGLILAFVFSVVGLNGLLNRTEDELSKELDSIPFPQNYSIVNKDYSPGGLDNDAILKYKYAVSGSREDVYQQVIKSLGLDPEEHKESYDQELHGVGSPNFKYIFWLTIYPLDDEFLKNDPCLANGEGDLEWKACKNKDPKRGKNLPANYMELSVIKR